MKVKTKNSTRNIIITLALILVMGCSVSFGVSYSKEITAWFYNIQVKLNGNSANFSKQPFIYNGSVYISLRDVSELLGIDVKWEGDTRTVYLTDNSRTNNIPGYYPNDPQYGSTNDIGDVEDKLNDRYDEYTDGDEDLDFEYDLSEQSNFIKVKMKGSNFKRDSSDWKDRENDDFEDFVKDIAELVADELDEDVKVYVSDKNNKSTARYVYDESKDEFEIENEYGAEIDEDDIEEELDEEYEEYTEGDEGDLKFKYDVKEYDNSVRLDMEGQNFSKDSSRWEDRNDREFRDFVEDIAKEVGENFEKDVTVRVYDDDEDLVGRYEYDESKNDFEEEYEYDEDNNIDNLISKLDEDFEKYEEGSGDLEFTYELEEKDDYTEVVMTGTNFKRSSSDWDDRDDEKFKGFIKDVAKEVEDVFENIDVKVEVKDEDGRKAGEYTYDESDGTLTVDYERDND